MKLSNVKQNNLAYIKKINLNDYELNLRIMEMGFIPMTKIKVIYKNKNFMIIDIRDYKIALASDICNNIEVI